MRALIVEDGSSRGALAAARALTQAGWKVAVGSPGGKGSAADSRATQSRHDVPPAGSGTAAFLDGVASAAEESAAEVVFGCGDAEVLTLSEGRDRLEPVVPYAPHESVIRAFDKVLLSEAAADAGFAVPRTAPATEAELVHVEGPVLVKARLHAVVGRTRVEAELCGDAAAARYRAAEIRAAGGEPLLQERLSGPLVAYTVFADVEGGIVAALQQEAEAIWPPNSGASVRARTVPVDADLAAAAARLLAELRWFGIAELQFIRRGDRTPALIDLNGRFYGSMSLALAAGVNLPAMWAALATGREVSPAPAARLGVRYQWLEGDLRRARAERRHGLVRDVWGCLVYAVGAQHSIWQAGDPAPALRLGSRLARRVTRKLLRR
jgi:predicted ATP-grasp superfamily ATP-dependent carboligase